MSSLAAGLAPCHWTCSRRRQVMNFLNIILISLIYISVSFFTASAYETVEDAGTNLPHCYTGSGLSLLFEAIIARSLVDDSPNFIATMATVYPSDHPSMAGTWLVVLSCCNSIWKSNLNLIRVAHFIGQPFALQEYYSTYYQNGSLLLLVLPISRHTQNVIHSPAHTASLTMAAVQPAARNARVSLAGNITIFWDEDNVPEEKALREFYLSQHPDAKRWLPNDDDAAHIVSE